MGEHDKALKIFIHNLEDFKAAENYCDQISPPSPSDVGVVNESSLTSSRRFKSKLLITLLKVYLDPELEKDISDKYYLPALDLINRRGGEMKPGEILEILPSHWSLSTVHQALKSGIQSVTHQVILLH